MLMVWGKGEPEIYNSILLHRDHREKRRCQANRTGEKGERLGRNKDTERSKFKGRN